MSGSTDWVVWKTPLRLTSITFDHSGNDIFENFWKPSTPAALTSTRIGPYFSRIAATAVSTCARSVTSATWPNSSSVGDKSMTAT
jgi:hypothetical protein